MALTFEWDARKAAANLTKHGVSFEEALTVFADPFARLEDDDRIQFPRRGSYYWEAPVPIGCWPSCSLTAGLSVFG